jgi:hypothetical protein
MITYQMIGKYYGKSLLKILNQNKEDENNNIKYQTKYKV